MRRTIFCGGPLERSEMPGKAAEREAALVGDLRGSRLVIARWNYRTGSVTGSEIGPIETGGRHWAQKRRY